MNFVQVLINGLITSGELGIIAIGLTMTFSVLRFANFAHTETAVVGAYLALLFNVTFGWSLPLSMAAAVVLTGVLPALVSILRSFASSVTRATWRR